MDLHELITKCQSFVADDVGFELVEELGPAYDCLAGLYDLLTEELVPMERPICKPDESS